jgi:hypothetical protein
MSDQKLSLADVEKNWYDRYTEYYRENKPSFKRLLKKAKQNISDFKKYDLEEFNQTKNLLGDMHDKYIAPFKQYLDRNNINEGIVAKTKDENETQLLKWFGDLVERRRKLNNLAQEINKLLV